MQAIGTIWEREDSVTALLNTLISCCRRTVLPEVKKRQFLTQLRGAAEAAFTFKSTGSLSGHISVLDRRGAFFFLPGILVF